MASSSRFNQFIVEFVSRHLHLVIQYGFFPCIFLNPRFHHPCSCGIRTLDHHFLHTVDFMKAFDSTSHKSIWEALKSCNVDHEYVSLLRKIYSDQKASVQTDEESKNFDIQKGSKQGDPMSSLLFNTVLQYSLKDEIQRWQKKKGMGIYLSDQDRDCLTNLRFADDVMLFATSKEQIQKMMNEFKKATEKVGLRIHPDKTKILSNQSTINSNTKRHIEVGEMSIEILSKK